MNLFNAIFATGLDERTAILYEEQQITYRELREQTIKIAHVLAFLKISRGERVALLLNDSPEFIAAFIAICSWGAIAVPINMALQLDEQRTILNDCSAKFAFAENELCAALTAQSVQELSSLDQIVAVIRGREKETSGQAASIGIHLLDDLSAQAKEQQAPEFPAPAVNQPAFILYTSGSTGEPKGAIHCQSDIFYTNETYCREVLQLREGDRLFSSSRLPFAYGFGNAFTFPLLNGHTTILCRERPTAKVVSRIFARYQPTIFFGVPVVYRLLLDELKQGGRLDCSSLRLCVSAGEALPAPVAEEWEAAFGVPILDGIGSTEMLHMWMSNHVDDVVYGSSGKVLEGYDARLLDPEGAPTPTGSEGNLWVKGASAALAYWNKPEISAQTFVDGWVRTGDLYQQGADGHWFHMGRSDDCFKSSGQWVSPVEVEGVLLRCAGISRAAVVEDFDADHLPCACAFIVRAELGTRNNSELEIDLRTLSGEALPRFKRPRKYVFVDELPYTATGKIQRFKLREQLKDRRALQRQGPKSS